MMIDQQLAPQFGQVNHCINLIWPTHSRFVSHIFWHVKSIEQALTKSNDSIELQLFVVSSDRMSS